MRGAVLEFYGYRNLNWIQEEEEEEEEEEERCIKELRAGSVGPRINGGQS